MTENERIEATVRVLDWLERAYPIRDEGFLPRLDEARHVVNLVLAGEMADV